jgi:prepilin-type N-terminal cleavage/methylation domain-containing protein
VLLMRKGAGFSLLELLLVLSLLAILGGVAVLAHQGIRPRLNLHMAVRQLMMDLKLARMRAIRDHVNYRIAFSGGGASYQVQRKTGSTYHDEGVPTPLPQGIWIVDCTAREHAIMFVPRGSAGSFGTVTLRNDVGDAQHVAVDIAGQMRVYQ